MEPTNPRSQEPQETTETIQINPRSRQRTKTNHFITVSKHFISLSTDLRSKFISPLFGGDENLTGQKCFVSILLSTNGNARIVIEFSPEGDSTLAWYKESENLRINTSISHAAIPQGNYSLREGDVEDGYYSFQKVTKVPFDTELYEKKQKRAEKAIKTIADRNAEIIKQRSTPQTYPQETNS